MQGALVALNRSDSSVHFRFGRNVSPQEAEGTGKLVLQRCASVLVDIEGVDSSRTEVDESTSGRFSQSRAPSGDESYRSLDLHFTASWK
jgi:hypothetical protein